MSAQTSSAEDILNAALHTAVVAVLGAGYETEGCAASPAELAEHIEIVAQCAAVDVLEGLIGHPKLRQTIARALAAEAVRLVKAGGH